MSKIARKVIAVILVVAMCLSGFAGCTPQDTKKDITTDYGFTFTDKTVSYSGEKFSHAVTIDETVLAGRAYSISYTYSLNGTALTGDAFSDAGEYTVTAKIKIDGDETEYSLSSKMLVKQISKNLTIGNIFIRQGSTSLPAPSSIFVDETFVGSDTLSSLGAMTFEVYSGTTKINDVSSLAATKKVADAYNVKLVFANAPTNYNVTVADGSLYVLSAADYTLATAMKEKMATVPSSSTINTFNYTQMSSFASNANYITANYKNLTDVQKLYTGITNIDDVTTFAKTANNRVNATYSLDAEVDTGVLVFVNAVGSNFSSTYADTAALRTDINTKTKNVIPLHRVAKDADNSLITYSANEVIYGDQFAVSVVVLDPAKSEFQGLKIRNMTFSASQFTPKAITINGIAATVYSLGEVSSTQSTNYIGKYEATGITVNNTLLGALDGKTGISIMPIIKKTYTPTFSNSPTSSYSDFGENKELSSITVSAGGVNFFYKNSVAAATVKAMPVGEEYKITVYPKDGFAIETIEVGSMVFLPSDMVNNSVTFTIDDDTAADNTLTIKVKTVQAYSVSVKINGKTIRDTEGTGVYAIEEGGGITLSGMKTLGTKAATIEGDTIRVAFNTAANYILSSFVVKANKTASGANEAYELIESVNNASTYDLEIVENNGTFSSSGWTLPSGTVFEIELTLIPVYNFELVVNGTVIAPTRTAFSTTYGTVTIQDPTSEEILKIARGEQFRLEVIKNDGYVLTGMKIGEYVYAPSTAISKLGENESLNSYIADNGGYFYYPATTEVQKYITVDTAQANFRGLTAGANIKIELTFEKYYFVNFDFEYSDLKNLASLTLPDGSTYTMTAGTPDAITWNILEIAASSKYAGSSKALRLYTGSASASNGTVASDASDYNTKLQAAATALKSRRYFVIESDLDNSIGKFAIKTRSRTGTSGNYVYYWLTEVSIGGTISNKWKVADEENSYSESLSMRDLISTTTKPGDDLVFYFSTIDN